MTYTIIKKDLPFTRGEHTRINGTHATHAKNDKPNAGPINVSSNPLVIIPEIAKNKFFFNFGFSNKLTMLTSDCWKITLFANFEELTGNFFRSKTIKFRAP